MKTYISLCLLAVFCRAEDSSGLPPASQQNQTSPVPALRVPSVTPGPGSDPPPPVRSSPSPPAPPPPNLTTMAPVGMTTAVEIQTDPETNSSSSPLDTSHNVTTQETTEEEGGGTTTSSLTTVARDTESTTSLGGYVILFFLLVAIVAMGIIIYLLRRRSRKYSFDLHRPGYDHGTPLTLQEQSGTFECVTEDHPEKVPTVDEAKHDAPSALANGTSPTSDGGGARDGDRLNNALTPPLKKVDFSLDIDLSDRVSNQSGSTFSFFGGTEVEQNENNNNDFNMPGVPVTSDPQTEVFTEISLDETV